MRLDKYLKVSRLIKRRTVANEACDNGRISVNGRVVKASYDVKVGDKLEIRFDLRTREYNGRYYQDVYAPFDAIRKLGTIGGGTTVQPAQTNAPQGTTAAPTATPQPQAEGEKKDDLPF